MDRPKVYNGLPDDFINKIFWPDRDYRTNPLSHIPGGSDLIIEYTDEKIIGYDWIKFPDRYCLVEAFTSYLIHFTKIPIA